MGDCFHVLSLAAPSASLWRWDLQWEGCSCWLHRHCRVKSEVSGDCCEGLAGVLRWLNK